MTDKHLSNDEFFSKLGQLLEHIQQKGHGSVYLTQKRLTNTAAENKPNVPRVDSSQGFKDLSPPEPLPLLVRATDGRSQSIDRKKNRDKVKLSTLVVPNDVEAFFSRYAETCRTNMQSLRKRDRSKKKNRRKKDNKKLDSTEGVTS